MPVSDDPGAPRVCQIWALDPIHDDEGRDLGCFEIGDHPWCSSLRQDLHGAYAAAEGVQRRGIVTNFVEQNLDRYLATLSICGSIHVPERTAVRRVEQLVPEELVLSRLGARVPGLIDRLVIGGRELVIGSGGLRRITFEKPLSVSVER